MDEEVVGLRGVEVQDRVEDGRGRDPRGADEQAGRDEREEGDERAGEIVLLRTRGRWFNQIRTFCC
ncbi:MAG: hypothetical protein M3422_15655 [Actinomycetota bacterium]|nr:hypothetical protein [Actinomycetota bacterium]